jgi:acetolactate decarboxylase
MNKHRLIAAVLLIASLISVAGCSPAMQVDRDTIFQTSTIGALMKGIYEGQMTVGELRPYGDFGLGTFEALDGEMVELDGKFYQVKLDGSVYAVPDSIKTPFAAVTFFDNDKAVDLDRQLDLNGLQSFMDTLLPGVNLFYAVKIDGKFSYMKTRSVPPQVKPYPLLTDAIKDQQVLAFRDVEGTMIGFRCPPYIEGVNVPGYHFHFLDKVRKRGGHVLDCTTSNVTIVFDKTAGMIMELPDTTDFNMLNLGQGQPEGLKQVEQGK